MAKKPIDKRCLHYRKQITECRRCDVSDAPFKICFQARKEFKGGAKLGIIDVE